MEIGGIEYKSGYKYQLVRTYTHQTKITSDKDIRTFFLALTKDGLLIVQSGYAWDGPSGPAIDTKNFMRGSLVHDALYQLIDEELIREDWKEYADELLRDICREDGMSKIRSWWVYWAVRLFGRAAPAPKEIIDTEGI